MKHRFLKALALALFVMAAYGLGMFSMTIADDARLIFSLVAGLSIGIVCAVISYKQIK